MFFNYFKNYLLVVISVVLVLIAGFRPVGFDPDSVAYSGFVHGFSGLRSIDVMDKEPGFWFLLYISQLVFDKSVTSFFLLYAFISVSIKVILYKRLSPFPFLSIILYIATYYILHDMNQIRIGLACAILLWSLQDIIKRNVLSFAFKIFIATLFHYSAIIGVVFYLFKTDRLNKVLYFTAPIICSIFLFFKDTIFEYSVFAASYLPSFLEAKVKTYVSLQQQGVFDADNLLIFNVGGGVVFIILSVFIFLNNPSDNKGFSEKLEILLIKLLSLQLVLGETLAFNSELSNRFFTLLGFITIPLLLPKLIKYIHPNWIAVVIVLLYATRQLYSSITGVFIY